MIGRRVFGLLAVLFLSAALMTGGCGREQEAAQVSYGVADLETLVKAHPLYPRYFRLQSESVPGTAEAAASFVGNPGENEGGYSVRKRAESGGRRV